MLSALFHIRLFLEKKAVMIKFFKICFFMVVGGIITLAFTQPCFGGAGESGVYILQQTIGAKGQALGDAFTAVEQELSSLYYNPAGVSKLDKPELLLMYLNKFSDGNLGSMVLGYPTAIGTFCASVVYFYGGKLELNFSDGTSREVT
jgi:hypothetical protein